MPGSTVVAVPAPEDGLSMLLPAQAHQQETQPPPRGIVVFKTAVWNSTPVAGEQNVGSDT